jgi:hypothetical protein
VRLSDTRLVAACRAQIADILFVVGELDECLRIRRESILPNFLRVGDIHSAALIRGQIADVLIAKGESEAALSILLEEQLPVYRRVSAVRELALTKAQVAKVLFMLDGLANTASQKIAARFDWSRIA